jgi:hypothetical protein
LKKYNDHNYRLTVFRTPVDLAHERNYSEKGTVNKKKLSNNISRARSNIYELVACNSWEHFVTLTVDGTKYNREDLKKIEQDLIRMIANYNYYNKTNIKFLFIPELHKDGKSIHFHGLMSGLPEKCLGRFTLNMHLPVRILEKLQRGKSVCYWKQYSERFGYSIVEEVENPDAVSAYMTKYITEDLASTVQELGAHTYFCSRGLSRAKSIKAGELTNLPEPDFSNDYCAITTFKTKEEAEKYFFTFGEEDFTYKTEELQCLYQSILTNGSLINA